MKISGIYKIQSLIKPERIYVGSSIDIEKRWYYHKRDLRKNKHVNSRLQRHFNKYGESDFDFSIIVGCNEENLISYEQFYIDSLNPHFNINKVANSIAMINVGRKHTKAHNDKIAKKQTGKNNSFAGKRHTIESRLKVREWNLLNPISEESRRKQQASLLQNIKDKKLAKLKNQLKLWQ